MSITTLVLINLGAAAALTVLLAAVMLAPSRLRRPFADGHTHRQRAALRAQKRIEAARQRRGRRPHSEVPWRAVQET